MSSSVKISGVTMTGGTTLKIVEAAGVVRVNWPEREEDPLGLGDVYDSNTAGVPVELAIGRYCVIPARAVAGVTCTRVWGPTFAVTVSQLKLPGTGVGRMRAVDTFDGWSVMFIARISSGPVFVTWKVMYMSGADGATAMFTVNT